jgi:hypothetical protein
MTALPPDPATNPPERLERFAANVTNHKRFTSAAKSLDYFEWRLLL